VTKKKRGKKKKEGGEGGGALYMPVREGKKGEGDNGETKMPIPRCGSQAERGGGKGGGKYYQKEKRRREKGRREKGSIPLLYATQEDRRRGEGKTVALCHAASRRKEGKKSGKK